MPTRRPARDQALPKTEAEYLAALHGTPLHQRCLALYQAGWTLRALGDALTPTRSRSTVRSWIIHPLPAPKTPTPAVPKPTLATPPVYIPKKAPSPGISATDLAQIQHLAPIARRFRAGMSPLHQAAQANDNLTTLVRTLNASGVSIQELADAAHVTYRAMYRRIQAPTPTR